MGGRGGLLAGLADPPLVRPGHQPGFRLLFRADLDTYIITTVRRRHYVLSAVLGTYLLTEEEHNDYSPWLACTCCTSSHAVSLGFWQNEHEYSFGSATRQFQLLLSVYILGGLILINDRLC